MRQNNNEILISKEHHQQNLLDEESYYYSEIDKYKGLIKYTKRNLHIFYTNNYHNILLFADILILLGLLCNVGALTITNALAVKANPDIVIYEANPNIPEYETHPNYSVPWSLFIRTILAYCTLIGTMYFLRLNINSRYHLYFYVLLACMIFFTLMYNFANDLGYFIGVKLWQ